MAADAAALAVKLYELVVPNYPFLDGADIAVMDPAECARRGTPEQRLVGRRVREVMEDIWALEDGHSLRRLLECFQRGCQELVQDRSRATSELQAGVSAIRRLPTEVVYSVLDHFLTQLSGSYNELQFVGLGCLRLVSKAVGQRAAREHEHLFKRYTDRVATRFLHAPRPAGKTHASVIYPFAALFANVTCLAIYLVGDEIDRVNSLLPLLPYLEDLTVHLDSEQVPLCQLHLSRNTRLETLRVKSPTWHGERDFPDDEELWDTKAVESRSEAEERTLAAELEADHGPHEWDVPPSWHRLELQKNEWEGLAALTCLGYLISDQREGTVEGENRRAGAGLQVDLGFCKIAPGQLEAMCLAPLPPWLKIRDLNLEATVALDDDALRGLDLGRHPHLERLNLRFNIISDASALDLASNRSLTHLNVHGTCMSSGRLGLHTNTTLQVLVCGPPINSTSTTRAQFLRELSEDLSQNTTLNTLSLFGAPSLAFEDDSLAALDLSANTGIRHLSLNGNAELTPAAIKALRLRTSKHLETVCLSRGDAMVKAFGAEIPPSGAFAVVWEGPQRDQLDHRRGRGSPGRSTGFDRPL